MFIKLVKPIYGDPMRMTLRQLEVFAATCRHHGVTAAATAVKLSQSAASQAVTELEAAVGGPLFERQGRRLQLNERGRQLLPMAVELLDRAAAIEAQLRRGTGEGAPQAQLAASLTTGNYLLPPLIARLLSAQPQARVGLSIANTGAVIAAVEEFRADAGFIEGACTRSDLDVRPWKEDRLLVVAAPGHALTRDRKLSAAALSGARWILREPGSGTREIFERAAAAAGITLDIALELGHTEGVRQAAMAGAGLACLSQHAVAGALARGELKALATPFLSLRRQLSLIRHRRKLMTPGLRAVLRACEVRAADLP